MSRNRYDRKLDRAFYAKAGQDQLIHGINKARFAYCEDGVRLARKTQRRLEKLAADVAQLKRYVVRRGRPPKPV